MKVVILAGGQGSRLEEETVLKPKPMVEIGGKPILWHILKHYSHFGLNEFIVCLGYKGYMIKEYFNNYLIHNSDVEIDLAKKDFRVLQSKIEPWRVKLIDTGERTLTGGRIKRIAEYLDPQESFCLTYGDGLANIDIKKLVEFHKAHGKLATVTATHPPARFGALKIEDQIVVNFDEKPTGDVGAINGGFFVLSPKVLKYIEGDDTTWEREPLVRLADDGQLHAFFHDGFWHPMDTIRDKKYLEDLWVSGRAQWKVWEN